MNIKRRAFIKDSLNSFMQAADIFAGNKVLYQDLMLDYKIEEKHLLSLTKNKLALYFARMEFGENLIVLFDEKMVPLYINPRIQVISTGKGWTTLFKALQQTCPQCEFTSNEHFTQIKLK